MRGIWNYTNEVDARVFKEHPVQIEASMKEARYRTFVVTIFECADSPSDLKAEVRSEYYGDTYRVTWKKRRWQLLDDRMLIETKEILDLCKMAKDHWVAMEEKK